MATSSKYVKNNSRFVGGISDYDKEGVADSFAFGRCIDHRNDPRSITLLPKTIKESGTVIQGLPQWGDIVGTDAYIYDNGGNLYKRTTAGSHSLLRTVADSHGNGLSYFGEDDFIYYTRDKVIGRYGPMTQTPAFADDYLGSQGGVPLNTNVLNLELASSQYAYRADTATLSQTGSISLEAQIKPESLPTGSDTMVFISKWNGSGNIRSYKFGMSPISNYFGDGGDGALVISVNTTDAPIDSACTGTSGATTLTATNVSFAAGQQILIHQSRGTGAGTWQKNKIQSYTAGTITLVNTLNATYSTGAQVLVLKEYTNVTVNTGITWTAKAWNGTVGGILAFLASGTVTVTGTITATGKGFLGAVKTATELTAGTQGEGTVGARGGSSYLANGSGGGGGRWVDTVAETGGGGGGHGLVGSTGEIVYGVTGGYGGAVAGTSDLTTMVFGGGGGAGAAGDNPSSTTGGGGAGGNGGGIIGIFGVTVTVTGTVTSNGNDGSNGSSESQISGGGGGGAGGSILIKSQVATLGSALLTSTGGAAGTKYGNGRGGNGAAGAIGRINLDYYTSYTGTTSPTLNVVQDNNLGASDGYQLDLTISSTGTNSETFNKPFTPQTAVWQHVAVSWDASTKTANFYHNGVDLGSQVGALTAISDNASEFFVGAYKNDAGTATGFYDGLIDEVRLWNYVRSQEEFYLGMVDHVSTTATYLQAYYKFNAAATDSTANANDLTLSGTPVYSTDVPFPAPTTRADIDQSATTASQTYALTTAINEGATHRKTFTPEKDPNKSASVLVAVKGSGDWTLTIHDQYNNTITSKTIVAADMTTGYVEFVFSSVWRPLINASYHIHLTSTVADGTVTTSGAADLETVSYRTYFQFLVEDDWHPIAKFLQMLVIGNERYVATYEATLYEPNLITLRSGDRVRCFGLWNEYLAIGTTRGTNIYDQDAGRVYFWDGTADTYNFFIDVPEGGVNALFGSKGKLYIFAGYQGDILEYSSGSVATKIDRVPKITNDKYIEVYPGGVTMWKSLLRFGVGNSDSSDVERGVYTYGSLNSRYDESMSFDHILSTGNYGSTVKIGLLMIVNKKLLIGWQDNVAYGVDYVDSSNDVYPSGTIEFMIEDEDVMWKEKRALTIVADFEPLASGESVYIKYKLNRSSSWVYNSDGATTTALATKSRLVLSTGGNTYNELQYAVDLATTTTTSPKLLGVAVEIDRLESEQRI